MTKEAVMLLYIRFRQFQGTKAWPLYFVLGNHEGENPTRFNHLYSDNLRDGRRQVIPNPTRDSGTVETFYKTPGDRDSYFAWEWGDALFIVLDPFGYCEKNVDDDPCNGDFDCDGAVDEDDKALFSEDFSRAKKKESLSSPYGKQLV